MPRKSKADLAPIRPVSSVTRLQPPMTLTGPARTVFTAIVANNASNHFLPSDTALLETYCCTIVQLEQCRKELQKGIVTDDGKVSPWVGVQERTIKSMVALSMRLRLSPQSRTDPKTLARQRGGDPHLRFPWESSEQYSQRCLAAGYEHDKDEGDE